METTNTQNRKELLGSKGDNNTTFETREHEDSKEEAAGKTTDDERIAKIPFDCSSCEHHEMVHYFGKQPPFAYGVEFCEPTYVMRDPFQAPIASFKSKAEFFVAIGAHCQICNNIFCKDNNCSFYYRGTYCLECARKNAFKFPSDVHQKLIKLT